MLDKISVGSLQVVVDELDRLIGESKARSFILPDASFDESMLIGCPVSYLRLARVLVETVKKAAGSGPMDEDLGEETLEGQTVLGANLIKDAFNELSPVWVICSYLTSDEDATKELARKLSEGGPQF